MGYNLVYLSLGWRFQEERGEAQSKDDPAVDHTCLCQLSWKGFPDALRVQRWSQGSVHAWLPRSTQLTPLSIPASQEGCQWLPAHLGRWGAHCLQVALDTALLPTEAHTVLGCGASAMLPTQAAASLLWQC